MESKLVEDTDPDRAWCIDEWEERVRQYQDPTEFGVAEKQYREQNVGERKDESVRQQRASFSVSINTKEGDSNAWHYGELIDTKKRDEWTPGQRWIFSRTCIT